MGVVDDPACDPNNPIKINIDDIKKAVTTIGNSIVHTPCTRCHLSDQTGMELYVKKEFLQYTGSFKERGARYCMMQMPADKKRIGVIGASAGNHAQGISYHGRELGIPVSVVMPVTAPIMKIQKCKKYGANVILNGKDMAEAKSIALNLAKERKLMYINGYDHPHVLAGVGTIGVEILEQVPNVDAVICPVGGGGLLAGVSTAIKALSPKTKVIGVESEKCPGFTKALEAGKPVLAECGQSLADGLAVPMVGVNAFETARHFLDKMIVVKEEMIAMAIVALVELEKSVVEGAGATGMAAILSGVLPELQGKKVVVILSGGNIDTTVLGRCLERGLAVLGRLIKFSVCLKDKPGGISELLQKLTEIGVSVKDVVHERAWVITDVFSVEVKVICETRGIEHAVELKELLDKNYTNVDFTYFPNVCTAKAIGL